MNNAGPRRDAARRVRVPDGCPHSAGLCGKQRAHQGAPLRRDPGGLSPARRYRGPDARRDAIHGVRLFAVFCFGVSQKMG